MTWDKTSPAGTDLISAGDDEIREMKTDIETALSTDGVFPGSTPATPIFRFNGGKGDTASIPAAADGGLYFDTDTGTIKRSTGSAYEEIGVHGGSSSFPAKIFYMSTNLAKTSAPDSNALYPNNVPKAWGNITCGLGGSATVTGGFNCDSASYSGNDLTVTLHTAMTDTSGVVQANIFEAIPPTLNNTGKGYVATTTTVVLRAWNQSNTLITWANGDTCHFVLFGEQ